MSAAPLWTIAEVARALGVPGKFPETNIDFVTQDSRLVKPGSLFVALSGTPSGGFVSSFASSRDGWEFAAVEQMLAARKPIFAICKGVQILNVVLGGTLRLAIPNHSDPEARLNNIQPLRWAPGVALPPASRSQAR